MKTSDPLSATDWQNLNGTVDPNTAGVAHRTGLAIAQFTSAANVPTVAPGLDSERFWGGTQDNGTQRKSVNSQSWFDVAGGDGGQVLVDPTNANYVYGTFFGISPYRFTDGGLGFFTNQSITNGINLSDRSTFYIPWVMNQLNPNQLFLGTYRLYRTDSAKAATAAAVTWKAITPDLTSGCTGPAPNGARGCFLSAIGVGGGKCRLHRLGRRTRLPEHGCPSERQSHLDPPRQQEKGAAEPAGPAVRGRPQQLPDRLRRVRRLQRRDADDARTRLQDDERRREVGRHQRQPAGQPGQLDHPRPVVPEHALRRHRRWRLRDV